MRTSQQTRSSSLFKQIFDRKLSKALAHHLSTIKKH